MNKRGSSTGSHSSDMQVRAGGRFRGYTFDQAKDSQGHTNRLPVNFPDGLHNALAQVSQMQDNPFTCMADVVRDCVIRQLDNYIDPEIWTSLKSQFTAESLRYQNLQENKRVRSTVADIEDLSELIRSMVSTRKVWDRNKAQQIVITQVKNVLEKMTDPYFRTLNLDLLMDDPHIHPLIPDDLKQQIEKELEAAEAEDSTPKKKVKKPRKSTSK